MSLQEPPRVLSFSFGFCMSLFEFSFQMFCPTLVKGGKGGAPNAKKQSYNSCVHSMCHVIKDR